MWLFVKDGFYSAVKHREKEDTIIVRARVLSDLKYFLMFVEKRKKKAPIVDEIFNADYQYRVEVDSKLWAAFVYKEAKEIDYDNYKNAACINDPCRSDAYLSCWLDLQQLSNDKNYA